MSSSTPNPRRRRIAGERKTLTRPAGTTEQTLGAPAAETATDTAPPRTEDRVGPGESTPPPTPSATPAAATPVSLSKDAAAGRPASTRRPAPPRLMVGVAAAAVVLLLTALVLALLVEGAGWGDWKRVQEHDQVSDAIRTAPGAAEQAAATILAYDYESLEADRDAAAALMTPEYREEYLETFDDLVLEAAEERKAQVEADVRASGVAAAGPDRVEVLLFVNQTTVSTANSGEPQTALNRVVLAMEKVDGAWRVDDITSY
jgi:Mce-associated membrane protein